MSEKRYSFLQVVGTIAVFSTIVLAVPVITGWIGKTVDIARVPDKLTSDEVNDYQFRTNVTTTLQNINWRLSRIESVVTNKYE